MNSWRDSILAEFIPNVSNLTLVADPDVLLTEEKLAIELQNRGFDLLEFNDAVEFRYSYESKYRSIWDRGDHTDLVVILRLGHSEIEKLPYDLLKTGRKLFFNLGQLFPNMSYPVVEQLDRSLLDDLFFAQRKTMSDRMGDNATKDFILRHVFKIAAELISTEIDLLQMLLRLHYSNMDFPLILAKRLVQVIQHYKIFQDWPLKEIVGDAEAFFTFLQERWPIFLNMLKGEPDQVDEDFSKYGLKFKGPELLPFDHQDILVYIDNLFVEKKLKPVQNDDIILDKTSWIRSGIACHEKDDKAVRISRLFDLIEKEQPAENSRYADWISLALKKAELEALVIAAPGIKVESRFLKMTNKLNQIFTQWLSRHFATLINLPPANPVMLHHVPKHMARIIEASKENRVALILVDGLALDQWICIRQILQEQSSNLIMRESALFAWIPTITSVSRQALFSGKPPLYFPKSIHTTNNEKKLWQQFWEGFGLSRLDVGYKRSLGNGDAVKSIDSVLNPEQTKAVGLVIDTVDKIMHGMQLGTAGMHNQVKQWCKKGFLSSLIEYLLKHNFQVWLTSDHGNIECKGMGFPSEGVIAETRGERVRVYPTTELRGKVAQNFPGTTNWYPVGLPSEYYPLIANGTDAFVNKGKTIVTHGGISIEEVIVPLIKFEKRDVK
ncbi:MAG: BREX-3 system phosphatase PglZ [Thermodesulfobacteriota bacterium]|nr:BREX-3 system phosphatase PglZ [Thermodesulfobacteriota bacterium]